MVYLHKSVFQSHGYLSSANCHVDSRWVLKVSGFALRPFRTDGCKELQVIGPSLLALLLRTCKQKKLGISVMSFIDKLYVKLLLSSRVRGLA